MFCSPRPRAVRACVSHRLALQAHHYLTALVPRPSDVRFEGANARAKERLLCDLLARILDRRIYSAAADSQLAEFGLDVATSGLVVSGSADDRAVADLDRRLARARMPHILLHRDQLLYLVLADSAVNPGS